MALTPSTRRRFLTVAGSGALAALLAGCAAPGTVSPAAAGVTISTIRVSGTLNRTLRILAPMVAEELASSLGARYVPGGGGATLVVDLTGEVLDDGDDGDDFFRVPFGRDSGVDQLDGRVTLIGGRNEVLAQFPLLVSNGATYRSVMNLYPDLRRLRSLAQTYAYWLVKRLG